MSHGLKQFIAELQVSDEARKRRWIFCATAVTMTLVAFFWLAHLNATVNSVNVGAGAVPKTELQESTFLATMKRGGAIIYENLFDFFRAKVGTKKEIDIESAHLNFQAPGIMPVEPRDIR